MTQSNVFRNSNNEQKVLNAGKGDQVEVIFKSSFHCSNEEEPQYCTGAIQDIHYQNFGDMQFPVSIDVSMANGEVELIYFADVEDIFKKKYSVSGYGLANLGVTLIAKGKDINSRINYHYENGSLKLQNITHKFHGEVVKTPPLSSEDQEFIDEVMRYGVSQEYMHFVLSKSK